MARPVQTIGELTKQKPIAKMRTGRVVGGKGNKAVVRYPDGSTQQVEATGAIPQTGATVRIDASDNQRPVMVTRGQFLGGAAASAMSALFGATSGTLTSHPLNSGYHTGTLDPAQAPWALNKAGDTLTGNIAANAGVTVDGVDISVFNAASFLTLGVSSAIPNEQVFTPNATLTGTPGGAGGNYGLGINLSNVNTWLALQTFGAGAKITDGQALTGTTAYAGGFTGDGWRVIDSGGKSQAEFDELIVRGTMRVYELIIHKIRAGNGSYLFAPGAKVKAVSGSGPYTIDFDTDHGLAVNDLIRAQKFDLALGGVYNSQMTVATTPSTTQITATLNSGAAPLVGFEYVRTGNTTDATRRGSIYITSDDVNAPRITIMDGVSTHAEFGQSSRVFGNWGRMNGYYGAGVSDWGFGVGDYAGSEYMRYADDAFGFEMKAAGGVAGITSTGFYIGSPTTFSRLGAYKFTAPSFAPDGEFGMYHFYTAGAPGTSQLNIENTTDNAFPYPHRAQTYITASGTGSSFLLLRAIVDGSVVAQMTLNANGVVINQDVDIAGGLALGGTTMPTDGDIRLKSRIEFATADADGGSLAVVGVNAGAGKGLEIYDYQNGRAMMRWWADARYAMLFNSYSSGAMLNIGDTAVDYPSNSGWASTLKANLLLSGLDYTSIGFHDTGSTVGVLRFSNANGFEIGVNTGLGFTEHELRVGDYLKVLRPLVFRGNRSTTQTLTTSGTWYDVDLDVEDTDVHGFTADGITFTVPTDGTYVISATCRYPSNATGARGLAIYDQTNSVFVSAQVVPACNGEDTRLNVCDTVQASTGQTYRVKVMQSSTASMNVGGTASNDRIRISMWRVN